MITLQKQADKDFVVLNFSDFQLSPGEWSIEHKNGRIIDYTLKSLYERVKPDLVTISGDIAWCGDYEALDIMASQLDKFGVPYAIVWGNHDQDGGSEKLIEAENVLSKHPLFLYERGPSELGYGNYIIAIEEDGKIIEALIMMDSHDHARCYDSEGKEIFAWGTTPAWGKLYPEQIEWYKEQIDMLRSLGCEDSTLIMHIPCYAYRDAFKEAYKGETTNISIEESYKSEYWNEGYEDSFGVMYENICSYPANDGVFDAISEKGAHTKNVLVGHDHKNCFSVVYKGVRLSFAVKTGAGCYWTPEMNGGTVLTVNKNGVKLNHEFVDVTHLL